MLTKPRWLLHLEGAAVFFLATFWYSSNHFSWGLYALLILAPDLTMLAYLKDARWGSTFYNLAHTFTLPMLLLLVSFLRPAHPDLPSRSFGSRISDSIA